MWQRRTIFISKFWNCWRLWKVLFTSYGRNTWLDDISFNGPHWPIIVKDLIYDHDLALASIKAQKSVVSFNLISFLLLELINELFYRHVLSTNPHVQIFASFQIQNYSLSAKSINSLLLPYKTYFQLLSITIKISPQRIINIIKFFGNIKFLCTNDFVIMFRKSI